MTRQDDLPEGYVEIHFIFPGVTVREAYGPVPVGLVPRKLLIRLATERQLIATHLGECSCLTAICRSTSLPPLTCSSLTPYAVYAIGEAGEPELSLQGLSHSQLRSDWRGQLEGRKFVAILYWHGRCVAVQDRDDGRLQLTRIHVAAILPSGCHYDADRSGPSTTISHRWLTTPPLEPTRDEKEL
ncbi:hypothetical protein EI94DRAFT_1338184 [Lactarius quietus]|nr:hypothetical protein EI94DRAFT_1338184 [Lactarius quietus]